MPVLNRNTRPQHKTAHSAGPGRQQSLGQWCIEEVLVNDICEHVRVTGMQWGSWAVYLFRLSRLAFALAKPTPAW